MKKMIFIAGALLAATTVFAFDTTCYKPKGKVNEYTKTEYSVTTKFGDYYRAPKVSYVHTIKNGLETESVELTNKGILVDKVSVAYDGRGNQIERTCSDADGNVSWKITLAYDERGNKIEESEFNENGTLISKTILKYNAEGTQIDESFYNGDGALLEKYISIIGENGKISETNAYYADGNLDEKTTFVYNNSGDIVEKTLFNAEGAQVKKIVNKIDNFGVLNEVQVFDEKNKLSERKIYKYDDAGNLTRETVYQVSQKFGSTVNELIGISEYTYRTDGTSSLTANPAASNAASSRAVPPTPSVPSATVTVPSAANAK